MEYEVFYNQELKNGEILSVKVKADNEEKAKEVASKIILIHQDYLTTKKNEVNRLVNAT